MGARKRVGIYIEAGDVVRDPRYLDALCDGIGLNLVIMWLSWGRLSDEVVAANPLGRGGGARDRAAELVTRGPGWAPVSMPDGDSMVGTVEEQVGPFFPRVDDDSTLRRAIEEAHARGIEVWLSAWAWSGLRSMYCPSKEEVTGWLARAFADFAVRYEVEGLDISHARFPPPGHLHHLASCVCPDCAARAAEMGYDFEAMVGAVEPGGARLLEALRDGDPALSRWLEFRCDIITTGLRRLHRAVHEAAGDSFVFGSDNLPPTLAPLAGHRYADWAGCSDFVSPLLSHVRGFTVRTFASWADTLLAEVPGMNEAEALGLAYGLLGYENLGMPDSLAVLNPDRDEFDADGLPLYEMVELELRKAAEMRPEGPPSYPIIHGEGWSEETVRALMAVSKELGHDGIIFQGTSSLVDYAGKA